MPQNSKGQVSAKCVIQRYSGVYTMAYTFIHPTAILHSAQDSERHKHFLEKILLQELAYNFVMIS